MNNRKPAHSREGTGARACALDPRHRILRHTRIATAVALSCLQHAAWAEARNGEAQALPSVTVSATKGARLSNMDLSTSVVPAQQIADAPQLSTDQIVNHIPGVYTPQTSVFALHPTSAIVSIRGFGNGYGTKTLVLIDGIPANDGFFRTVDWSLVPKGRIERIEVIRGGGATSLWGNLAMGGVINIVTREPQPNEKSLDVSYGSFNTRTATASLTLLSNETLRIGLNADTLHTDGYRVVPAQYRNASNDGKSGGFANNVSLSAYLRPDAASKFYLQLYDHTKHEDNWILNNSSNTWDKYGVRGGGEIKLSDSSSLNAYAWFDRTSYFTQNATQTGGYSLSTPGQGYSYVSQLETAPYKSAGGSVYWQKDIGPIHELKLGFDYRYIGASDHTQLYNTSGVQTSVFDSAGQHRFWGVFAQGTYRAASLPLDVTLGLRGDFWSASHAALTGRTLTGSVEQHLADQSRFSFNPRLGAKYYFDNGIDLRAAVYKSFSAPGMNQMYRSFASGSTYTSTNDALVPESNIGEEIGLDLKRSRYTLSFTAFRNRVDHFIDLPSLCNTAASCSNAIAGSGLSGITSVRQYRNVGKATIMGLEWLGDVKISPTLTANAGLTYTSAYLTESTFPAAAPTHSQIGQIPRWVLTSGAQWQATPALQLSASIKAWPGYWYNTAHTIYNSGAAIIDISARFQVRRNVELYGTVQNLAGHRYFDLGSQGATSEPRLAPPFAAMVGLRLTM